MSLKGLPFIGKMNDFINRTLHPTVQKVGYSHAALDVTSRSFYNVGGNIPLVIETGSDDNILVCSGCIMKVGDVIRLNSTSNDVKESEIVVDAIDVTGTIATLAGFLSAPLVAGDDFYLLRPVRELVASDGSSLATVVAPPAQYNVKAAGVTTATTVLEDLDTPANSKPMPVAIHSINGAPINIQAGDLSVSISHTNDSVAIGDGTRLVGVTATNELKTHDANLLTELQKKANLTDTQPVSVAGTVAVSGPLTDTQLRTTAVPVSGTVTVSNLPATQPVSGTVAVSNFPASQAVTGAFFQATQPVSLSTIPLATNAATDTVATANGVLIGAVNETAPSTDTGSSGTNGRLQRIAQRLTSLIALFPTSIGQKTMAGSLSIAIASDQGNVPTKEAATSVTYNESLVVAFSGVTTISAPAGAKGCKVITPLGNLSAINITLDGTTAPSATVGMEIQAGRSEDFIGVGASLKAICNDGASTGQKISVHWYV